MQALTPRDRVFASIQRRPIDALPWQFDLTSTIARKLQAYYGTQDLVAAMGDHFVCTGWTAPRGFVAETVGEGLSRNEFGVVWSHREFDRSVGDWGGLSEFPIKEPALAGYKFPDGAAPGRWDHMPALRKKHPDQFVLAWGPGLFESAWALCGFENYLSYIAGEPAFVEEVTENLADYACAVTAQLAGTGVDGIRYGDDWGLQHGPMIDPGTWRRLFKKRYRRVFDSARALGLPVMIHSCGNITDLLDDFIDIGVQVVHAFQPEAMDVAACQKRFGKNVSFWGGLGSQSTIPNGTPEDCRREVRDRLKLFEKGGYILAPAGAIPTEAPVANVAAIVQEAFAQLGQAPPFPAVSH